MNTNSKANLTNFLIKETNRSFLPPTPLQHLSTSLAPPTHIQHPSHLLQHPSHHCSVIAALQPESLGYLNLEIVHCACSVWGWRFFFTPSFSCFSLRPMLSWLIGICRWPCHVPQCVRRPFL